jgi:hypothetical protein
MQSFKKQIYRSRSFKKIQSPPSEGLIFYVRNEDYLGNSNFFCGVLANKSLYFDVAPNLNTIGVAKAYEDEDGATLFDGAGEDKYYILVPNLSPTGGFFPSVTITGGNFQVVEIDSEGVLLNVFVQTVTNCSFPFAFNRGSFTSSPSSQDPASSEIFYLKLTDINANGSIKNQARIYTDSNLTIDYNPQSGDGNYDAFNRRWIYCAEPSFQNVNSKFNLQIGPTGIVQGYQTD